MSEQVTRRKVAELAEQIGWEITQLGYLKDGKSSLHLDELHKFGMCIYKMVLNDYPEIHGIRLSAAIDGAIGDVTFEPAEEPCTSNAK